MRNAMSDAHNLNAIPDRAGRSWQIALWSAQLLLALFFGMSGLSKNVMPVDALVTMGLAYAKDIPYSLLRFIGIAELAGAIGIIVPALTRIKPVLTPLAALGFATIQVLAICFHTMRGEFAGAAPINLLLLGLSLFVVWGRLHKVPITARY